jgi:hypothetical protein
VRGLDEGENTGGGRSCPKVRSDAQAALKPVEEILLQICYKRNDVKQSTQFIIDDYVSRARADLARRKLDISIMIRHPAIPPAAQNT